MHISRRSFLKLLSALPLAVVAAKVQALAITPIPDAPTPVVTKADIIALGTSSGRGNLIIDFGEHKLYCSSVSIRGLRDEQFLNISSPFMSYQHVRMTPELDLTVDDVSSDTIKWIHSKIGGMPPLLQAEVYIVEDNETHHMASLMNTFFTSFDTSLSESGGDLGANWSVNASLIFDYAEMHQVLDEVKL